MKSAVFISLVKIGATHQTLALALAPVRRSPKLPQAVQAEGLRGSKSQTIQQLAQKVLREARVATARPAHEWRGAA